MPDFIALNLQAQILFWLLLIAFLLAYIVFFKDSAHSKRDRR